MKYLAIALLTLCSLAALPDRAEAHGFRPLRAVARVVTAPVRLVRNVRVRRIQRLNARRAVVFERVLVEPVIFQRQVVRFTAPVVEQRFVQSYSAPVVVERVVQRQAVSCVEFFSY